MILGDHYIKDEHIEHAYWKDGFAYIVCTGCTHEIECTEADFVTAITAL